MQGVKSKDTRPEVIVRKRLHALGNRFRIHRKDLPGTPDIVLPKYNIVIEVQGCFWHHHRGCAHARIPDTNREFWKKKIDANIQRDKRNSYKLEVLGWKRHVIWECETENVDSLDQRLLAILKSSQSSKKPDQE